MRGEREQGRQHQERAAKIHRERPGAPRSLIRSAQLGSDGSFSLADLPPVKPVFYRAVYRDPATAIPYAALSHDPVG